MEAWVGSVVATRGMDKGQGLWDVVGQVRHMAALVVPAWVLSPSSVAGGMNGFVDLQGNCT